MRIKVPLAWLALGLATALLLQPAAAGVSVLRLYHEPDAITPDDEVVVYIEVNDSANVSKAYIVHCLVDPPVCYQQVEMRYIGGGVFKHVLGKFKAGQEIKYNVTLLLKNNSTQKTQDVHFTPHEPGNGGNGGNGNNTTAGNNGTSSPPNYIPYILIVVVVTAVGAAAVMIVRRKASKEK